MVAGSADYTTTDLIVTVPGCNYWNGIGTNNCGYIDEVDETSALLMELFRLRVQLSTITMRLLATITPARLLKDLMWFTLH
jgi:hypothetical protein